MESLRPLLSHTKLIPYKLYLIDRQHEDMTGGRMPPKAFYTQLRRAVKKKTRRTKALDAEPAESPRVGFEPELVPIPAGPFLMGSDDGVGNERPQHTVELSAYWIGKYPVTNAEYQAFVRDAWREPPDHWKGDTYPKGKGDHPVVRVSWKDAVAYCKWLGAKTGKEYRLSTEAQWEKAARGDDGRKYPWGNEWDASRLNSGEGGRGDTTPVGQFSPKGDSPYDVADMAGNVFEWCADWYDEAEYKRRAGSTLKDPEGPKKGKIRVLRGGSFDLSRVIVRCAARNWLYPDLRYDNVGFRFFLRPLSVDGRSIDG